MPELLALFLFDVRAIADTPLILQLCRVGRRTDHVQPGINVRVAGFVVGSATDPPSKNLLLHIHNPAIGKLNVALVQIIAHVVSV